MAAEPTKSSDVLLRTFLCESDDASSDRLLEDILCGHARPIIKRVIASRLNVGRGRHDTIEWQEQEDIAEEVVVQLIRQLTSMRGAGADAFASFEDYVAATAHNACSNYLRRKYPERSRLAYKLRYILSHHERFGLWRPDGREWLCGLVSWKNQRRSEAALVRLRQWRSDALSINDYLNSPRRERDVLLLIKSIFEFVGGPVALDELIEVVAGVVGMKDRTSADQKDESSAAGVIQSDAEALVADRIDKQAYLRHVWKEISDLPLEQRAALLLNLKDKEGSDTTIVFISSGAATITEMADALELSLEEFLLIWKKLPLSDEQIATRLAVKTRQVASLRQSARRRLSRRMEAYESQKKSRVKQL